METKRMTSKLTGVSSSLPRSHPASSSQVTPGPPHHPLIAASVAMPSPTHASFCSCSQRRAYSMSVQIPRSEMLLSRKLKKTWIQLKVELVREAPKETLTSKTTTSLCFWETGQSTLYPCSKSLARADGRGQSKEWGDLEPPL